MKAVELARVLGGELIGNPKGTFSEVFIDSRKLQREGLFFALKGRRHDGHEFVQEVLAKGGAGAVVERDVPVPEGKFAVRVNSTKEALRRLASYRRDSFTGITIGVAGSVGKTTTKELIHHLLSAVANSYKSEGNLNSSIGLPLVLANMPTEVSYAVLELGASALGDVLKLTKLAKPKVRVITAIGEEHLETFGSLDNVIKGNGEIFHNFSSDDFGVIPDYAEELYTLPRDRVITFGGRGDLKAENLKLGVGGTEFSFEGERFSIPVLSSGIVNNALASFGVLRALGYDPREFRESLKVFNPPEGRMRLIKGENFYLIDDTYNANPPSVRNALKTLSEVSVRGKRIVVLGDMLELGEGSSKMHREVGKEVIERGIDLALFYGEEMKEAYEECKRRGGKCIHFDKKEDLKKEMLKYLKDNNIILVKGSRGMRMEQLIEELGELNKYGSG